MRLRRDPVIADDQHVIRTTKAELYKLRSIRCWLEDAYGDTSGEINSDLHRIIAQELAENALEIQLSLLLIGVHSEADPNRRSKLRREYLRKRMTLHPPARPWLRYLLIGIVAAGIASAVLYLFYL